MSRTVYRISIMLHALWMLAASPALADDASARRPGDDRWLPSLSIMIGFSTQQQEGRVESCQFQFFTCNLPLRPSDRNWKNLTLLHAGGSLEFETPVIPIPYVRPRFFFGGEVQHVSSQRRSIAKEENPKTELVYPVPNPEENSFPDSAILGQGSETISDASPKQFGAFFGISFPVDIGDWRFSIKPSARYLQQKFNFYGIVSEADRPGVLDAPPPTTVVLLEGTDSLDVHALGPALELEVSAVQVKKFSASIFVMGGAYHVLSDRDVSFSTRGASNLNPTNQNYRGSWSAEIDPWIYRASAGVRFRWTGGRSGWFFTGSAD